MSDRFWSKVAEPFDAHNDCWIWKNPGNFGYGRFSIGPRGKNRNVMAHVWSYEFFNGPVPAGKELHHNCENRSCVNPSHLEALTPREHHYTKKFKTFGTFYRNKTHCPQGHPYSGNNLYIFPTGARACRICMHDARRRYRERKKMRA